MTKIITDEKQADEVLDRGVETVYPDKKELKKLLLGGKQIKLYCGFDPSANSLHIGNAIALNKLSQFQELGHKVIFLIGDFTGMIGDPTDKSAARKKLTREDVLANSREYQKQASAYLDFEGENKAEVLYNSQWSDPVSFRDLIELTSNFTVQKMIQRDMFQKRLEEEKPIYLHEFMYPLAQGFDSVAMGVDLEVGGNDQMFNMMCGRDLMKVDLKVAGKKYKAKEKFVMTLKLLADDSGKKMGKSEGNAVFLNQAPNDMYGAVMSWTDGVIYGAFELATKVSQDELKKIKKELEENRVNPRDLKMKLAREMVKIVHGEEASLTAENYFITTFQKKETPDDIPEKKIKKGKINILDLLVEVDLVKSKGEARRLINQGGIKLNEEAIKDVDLDVEIGDNSILIQRGKRVFLKVKGK